MNGSPVLCPTCNTPLPQTFLNAGSLADCPGCATPIQVQVFPAFYRPMAAGQAGEVITVDGEAGCFYHPQKKAAVPCDRCGRFLCTLCDVELNGEHICPSCLESGKQKGKLASLENRRILYDDIALALATYPVVLCYFPVPLTAPAVLFMAYRYWKAPGSFIPRTKARFIIAIILAVLELLALIALVVVIVVESRSEGASSHGN